MRLTLLAIFTTYSVFHNAFPEPIKALCIASGISYMLLNLYSLYWIRRTPYSLTRILLIPMFDIYVIILLMWVDGGQMSVLYFLLVSPIFGNGFRFGSKMLRYCQVLALIGMAAISYVTVYYLHKPVDWFGLAAELFAIFYITTYAYGIIRRIEGTVQEKKEAEASADRLISETPHPAFTFDLQAQGAPIIYANPAMATLISLQPELLPGMPIESLVIPEDRLSIRKIALSEDNNSALQQCYIRIPNHAGTHLQVMCEIRRTLQEGRQIGLCYLTDISESERLQGELAEAQKQAHTAALVAGVAHDFRNLLAGIIGHAELIEMDHNHPQLQKDIRQVIKSGQRGSDMVNQLLQMGRNNKSDAKVQNISDSINRMMQLARVQLPPDIDLSIEMDNKLPMIHVNIAQIEQVLLNLVTNAAQAMLNQKGQIMIVISHQDMDVDRPGINITVRDNGCGIDPDHLPLIFKAFWSTRKDSGGTGLGLAMVQRIIRWHNGMINVESRPGQGTVFNIFLPEHADKKQSDENLIPTTEQQSSAINTNVRPWHILLVEDQMEVMAIHKAFLSRMGHQVQTAINGKSAYAMVQESNTSFDMILTDYMMPEMDGLELTKAVRKHDLDLPITIVTAFGEDDALNEIRHSNTYFLNKPLSYQQLQLHFVNLQNGSQENTEISIHKQN